MVRDRMHLPQVGSGNFRPCLRLTDPFEPYFVPIGVDAPRAEEPILAQAPTACYAVKDKTIITQVHHPARPIIDNSVDPTEDSENLAAIRHHLNVEPESTVPLSVIDGLHDFFFRANLNEFSRL